MKPIDFTNEPLNEIVGDDERVLKRAKEMAERLHIDLFITPLKELPFYKEYLRYFDLYGLKFQLPLFSEMFDSDLLIKLIVASHSSTYDFIFTDDGDIRMVIHVSTESKNTQKNLDELDLIQIIRLYNIYLNELIEFELMQYDSDFEKEILLDYRKKNIQKFYENKNRVLKLVFYNYILKG